MLSGLFRYYDHYDAIVLKLTEINFVLLVTECWRFSFSLVGLNLLNVYRMSDEGMEPETDGNMLSPSTEKVAVIAGDGSCESLYNFMNKFTSRVLMYP